MWAPFYWCRNGKKRNPKATSWCLLLFCCGDNVKWLLKISWKTKICILYRTPCYCLISVPEVEHGGGNENKSVILSSVVKLLREEYDNTAVGFQCRLSAHWQPQCYDRNKSQIQPGNRAWKYQCNDLWRNLYISLLINKVCVTVYACNKKTRNLWSFFVSGKQINRAFFFKVCSWRGTCNEGNDMASLSFVSVCRYHLMWLEWKRECFGRPKIHGNI